MIMKNLEKIKIRIVLFGLFFISFFYLDYLVTGVPASIFSGGRYFLLYQLDVWEEPIKTVGFDASGVVLTVLLLLVGIVSLEL